MNICWASKDCCWRQIPAIADFLQLASATNGLTTTAYLSPSDCLEALALLLQKSNRYLRTSDNAKRRDDEENLLWARQNKERA